MRRVDSVKRAVVPGVVVLAVAASLAGCVPTATPSGAPTPTSSSTGTPTIALNGTASDNKAYFDYINKKLIDEGGDLSGRPFIDNLVKAGYPKVDMEVTPDRTTVNLAADNISFSIRFGNGCLIGQYGNTGYSSTVAKLLTTSKCLVGTTRKIDW